MVRYGSQTGGATAVYVNSPFITSRHKMRSRLHNKYCVHIVLLVLTVLTELTCLIAALTIPEQIPQRISLGSVSTSEADLDSESVDPGDNGPSVRSDFANLQLSDGNLIDHNSRHSDSRIINGVAVNGEGEKSVFIEDLLLYSTLPPNSDQDNFIDQLHASEPIQRRKWRPTPGPAVSSTISDFEDIDRSNNNDRNIHQTNGSDRTDSDNSTEETTAEIDAIDGEKKEEELEPSVPEIKEGECILGSSDVYLAWWINNDGSLRKNVAENDKISVNNFLDLSGSSRSEGTVFDQLMQRLYERVSSYIPIKFLSLARNNLERAPYSSLNLISTTLEYLSLAGNNFSLLNSTTIKDYDWATFPVLEKLKELDLRSCKISTIQEEAFSEMQSLQKMYLSNNNLITLSSEIFASVRNLIHLDLSYNTIEFSLTNFLTNPFERFTRGLEIDEYAFEQLSSLKFLDFSFTRLEPSSMKSFVYLPYKLEQLSLCYTGISVIGLGMFHRMPNLKVLDLSGNNPLTGSLNRNTFAGLESSLEILAFENSSVKNLDWLGNLRSLKMLKLNSNNINLLTNDTFSQLPNIDILDLSDNHIGNWFSRVFETNSNLRILNLRSNNINVITTEMMKDFTQLEYLGLANNNFICNCMLRDLLDQALQNSIPTDGVGYVDPKLNIDDLLINEVLNNYLANIGLENPLNRLAHIAGEVAYSSYTRVLKSYVRAGLISYLKIRTSQAIVNADTITPRGNHNHQWQVYGNQTKRRHRYIPLSRTKKLKVKRPPGDNDGIVDEAEETTTNPPTEPSSFDYYHEMDFNFQLLDFDETTYICFNATTNEEYIVSELESCLLERVSEWYQLVQQLRPHQQSVSVVLCVIFVIMFITCIAYYKWWYIRYFFILIKNATILSFLNKESSDNGSRKSFGEISRTESYLYDVFVSYCDENREWVINELLPNIEQRQEISICLHERDFLVGLSILENIIACMDRSKCLLLVVSQSFLLSQWCQFEMHLAQHRLLETCRERLVLILLEDIPKRKRPKTLGYLMKTKTYIKWPTAMGHPEKSRSLCDERKIFWKRLRRALIEFDWESDANTA